MYKDRSEDVTYSALVYVKMCKFTNVTSHHIVFNYEHMWLHIPIRMHSHIYDPSANGPRYIHTCTCTVYMYQQINKANVSTKYMYTYMYMYMYMNMYTS